MSVEQANSCRQGVEVRYVDQGVFRPSVGAVADEEHMVGLDHRSGPTAKLLS